MTNTASNVLPPAANPSSVKFWPTFLLALFLGFLGIHRFYLKSPKLGLLMLVTLGGLGFWALIDVIRILLGKFKDGNGAVITNPKPVVSWAIFVIVIIVAGSGSPKSSSQPDPDTDATRGHTYADLKSNSPRIPARVYAKQIGETYGSVADVSSVPNGSYAGFPTGRGIETYQVTTYPRTGSSRTTSIIIALQPSGDDWEIVKKVVNH
jgi:TM2 domain-containing membrane protein YozV